MLPRRRTGGGIGCVRRAASRNRIREEGHGTRPVAGRCVSVDSISIREVTMKRIEAWGVVALGAFIVLCAAQPVAGQSNVKVVLSEVVDDRISDGMGSGGLLSLIHI